MSRMLDKKTIYNNPNTLHMVTGVYCKLPLDFDNFFSDLYNK